MTALFKQVSEPDGKGGTYIKKEISLTIKQPTGFGGITIKNIYFEKGYDESHVIVLDINGIQLPLSRLKSPYLISNNVLPKVNKPFSFKNGEIKIEAIANVPGVTLEFIFSVEYEYSN